MSAEIQKGNVVVRKVGKQQAGTVLRVYQRGGWTNKSPNKWVAKVRWEHATRRLSGSTHMITEVRLDNLRLIEESAQ